jgi:hypothetical protein
MRDDPMTFSGAAPRVRSSSSARGNVIVRTLSGH